MSELRGLAQRWALLPDFWSSSALRCNLLVVFLVFMVMGRPNEQEFTDFVGAHGDQLLRYARLMMPDPVEAEDVLQVALMRLFRKWGSTDSPVAYTKAILVNLVKDGARRSHLVAKPTADTPTLSPLPLPDVADAVVAQERLDQVLGALPTRQRLTVILRILDERSEADTASILDCSIGTVKSNLSRGLDKLRVGVTAIAEQPEASV
ncbi:MAG: SigE family RNA polymerase sigma factor [Anaerolineaceae bacterium]